MNEQMKKHLEDVVTAIVNEKSDEAKQSFAQYLTMKTKSILEGAVVESEEVETEQAE